MRHRENLIRVPGASGTEYTAWVNSWDPHGRVQQSLDLKSEIFDDLGYGKVNPLHSYQVRATRSLEAIFAIKWPGAYRGTVSLSNAVMHPGYLVDTSLQDLGAWATKGAARARTLDPVIDLGQELGELTEIHQLGTGLESILSTVERSARSRRHAFDIVDDLIKGTGQIGLYASFGVKPVLETLVDLRTLRQRYQDAAAKAIRNSGKLLHQHVELLNTTTEDDYTVDDGCWPSKLAQSWMISNSAKVSTVSTEKIWFETGVSYNLPKSMMQISSPALMDKLLGRQVNAATLYELLPYSWLSDWFTSTGAIVSNAMDHTFYRFVNPCIMHQSTRKAIITGELRYYRSDGSVGLATPRGTVTTTVKRRAGYLWGKVGLTLPELNNFQVAIASFLAAAKSS